jgi:hypothetical protein
MITMEFEELQKIWDGQNNEPLYVFNIKALHNRILSKKKNAGHIANFSELLLILVNFGAGGFVIAMTMFSQKVNVFMYLVAGWMFITALYVLASRVHRIKATHRFDRSMLGDLNHAISDASYQVRLAQLMRWNIFPIATLVLLGMWNSGKPIWIAAIILVFFAITYYASGWENNIYKRKKRELEVLQKKLINEDTMTA